MAILLKNATYIDWETTKFHDTNIIVHENADKPIQLVNDEALKDTSGFDEVIDCRGKFVTKSFVAGHHHVYSALAKGMPAPKKNPEDFREILKYVWWTLDKALDKESVEASALATAVACAKAGVTFAIDHHASPNFIKGSLDVIANAFDKVGVGHLLAYEITDRDGLDKAQQGLDETADYISRKQGLVGMHASFTIGNDTMQNAAKLMQQLNSGFHIHVAEDAYDQTHCVENYDKRVVERLADFGVLESSKTILVHTLHLSDKEREIIKNSLVWVAENKESNLNNNVGHFDGSGLGENIMLGTDGMHSDMLQSAKAAFFAGQGVDNIDYPSVYQRFRNVHKYLKLNGFKGDETNNLVVLDYPTATPLTENNFLGHFVFGINSNHVEHVISKGRLIVKNRKPTLVDESEVMQFAQEQAIRLWKRMQK